MPDLYRFEIDRSGGARIVRTAGADELPAEFVLKLESIIRQASATQESQTEPVSQLAARKRRREMGAVMVITQRTWRIKKGSFADLHRVSARGV
jgi:hypothetical protein